MSKPHGHCTFCDLVNGAGEVSVCYEDSDAIAFLDIQPVNAGHVLVVPRQHYETLFDVPRELGVHLFDVTMRLAGVIRHVTGCADMNLVVNSGAAAGQDEPHYHVHIIPRKPGDGFDVPLPWSGSEMPDRTLLDAVAARIIAELRNPVVPRSGVSAEPLEREVPTPVHREDGGARTDEERPPRRPDGDGERAPADDQLMRATSEGPHGELQLDDEAASRA